LDITEDDLGIFFNVDLQLSEPYAKANDLVARKDSAGNRAGGFFAENRRVRAQKFRQEKSEGFWMPISSLKFSGYNINKLKAGDEFEELNGVAICNKYITPQTAKHLHNMARQSRSESKMFKVHFETEQLRHHIDQIPAGALIVISEKCHGTSHRMALVLDDLKLPKWLEKIYKWIGIPTRQWKELHGSRRVILDGGLNDPYYKSQFRGQALRGLEGQLYKGEVLYLEIVGYTSESTPIMPRHNVKKLKDKAMLKKYGEEMVYSYGCIPGQSKAFIYRIVMTNEDGKQFDLSWSDVVRRSGELGVGTVPEIERFIYDGNKENLRARCEQLAEGESLLNHNQIREGICVRVEHPSLFAVYKLKSFQFLEMEANSKDDLEMIDIEEAS
jgi:hypothetical protein